MPRIRSIKPEHRQHRKVGPLTDREFRLWIAMISEADDEGRLVCDAAQLRVLTWAYHPKVTTAQTEAAIQVLAKPGLIVLYVVDGIRYAVFPSWHDHQHPKYPTPSKLPPPPPEDLPQHSPNSPPGVPEDFPTRGVELRGVDVGLDRDEQRGIEHRGEGSGERGNTVGDGSPTPPRSLVAPQSSDHSHSNPEVASTPAGKGTASSNGHGQTYRRPAPGEWDQTLEAIKANHPELSESEQQARALARFTADLSEGRR